LFFISIKILLYFRSDEGWGALDLSAIPDFSGLGMASGKASVLEERLRFSTTVVLDEGRKASALENAFAF
jgi:hypothetical protein